MVGTAEVDVDGEGQLDEVEDSEVEEVGEEGPDVWAVEAGALGVVLGGGGGGLWEVGEGEPFAFAGLERAAGGAEIVVEGGGFGGREGRFVHFWGVCGCNSSMDGVL